MIKKIISLVVFLLLANAGSASGSSTSTISSSRTRCASCRSSRAASPRRSSGPRSWSWRPQNQIPLDPDFVEMTRKSTPGVGDHFVIKVAYAVMVPVFPGNPRRFEFDYTTP